MFSSNIWGEVDACRPESLPKSKGIHIKPFKNVFTAFARNPLFKEKQKPGSETDEKTQILPREIRFKI